MLFWTKLDEFIRKTRRRSFFFFTSIVVLSTVYVWISMSSVSDMGKRLDETRRRKKKGDKSLKDKKRSKRTSRDELAHQKDGLPLHQGDGLLSATLAATPDAWSRRQMYAYLAQNKVYPSVETPTSEIKALVLRVLRESAVLLLDATSGPLSPPPAVRLPGPLTS